MIKLFCTGKVTPKTLEAPQHGVQCVDKKKSEESGQVED